MSELSAFFDLERLNLEPTREPKLAFDLILLRFEDEANRFALESISLDLDPVSLASLMDFLQANILNFEDVKVKELGFQSVTFKAIHKPKNSHFN